MSQNQNQTQIENQNHNVTAKLNVTETDIDREIERLKALRKQQEELVKDKTDNDTQPDKVTEFLNSGGDFAKLPAEDGGKKVYQFFADKNKRRLVIKRFIDPKTKEAKDPQTRVQYDVIDPTQAEGGEKQLECPKTLAQQIEDNINKGHCLLEITRRGTGVNSRYSAIAC